MNRIAYLCAAWFFLGLATIGIFLPLLPTTPFLLIALGAFMRSSPRLERWLRTHPIFGPYIHDWTEHRAVPLSAKILAVSMMSVSFLWLALFSGAPAFGIAVTGTILLCVAIWLVTRPTAGR